MPFRLHVQFIGLSLKYQTNKTMTNTHTLPQEITSKIKEITWHYERRPADYVNTGSREQRVATKFEEEADRWKFSSLVIAANREDREILEEIAKLFPKYCKARVAFCCFSDENNGYVYGLGLYLSADQISINETTGEVNETAVKRARKIMEIGRQLFG